MSNRLLYIDEQLVDLDEDTKIARTLQAFDIGQLGSVKVNFTNQFKIEKTPTNKAIFEYSDDIKSQTAIPYTSLSVKYIEDGQEVIPTGRVILKETDTHFLITIYEGPFGFFDFIQTKKLWDLDFSDLNGDWTSTTRDGYRNATTGILCALVNDGQLTLLGNDIQISVNTFPQVYYHTVIEKIFTSSGYGYEGTIFSDEAYLKLVIPLRLRYPSSFIEAKRFIAYASGSQSIVNPAAYVNVTFTTNIIQGSDNFYDGTSQYVVDNPDTSSPYFISTFKAQITITVVGGTVDIVLEQTTTGGIDDTQTNLGSGTYEFTVSTTTIAYADGDIIRLKVINNTGTPTVTVTSGLFYSVPLTGIVDDGTIFAIPAGYIYYNLLFDDFNQTDLLKDFCVRFGVQMTERNGVIVCKTLNEVIADKASMLDWTEKRVGKSENIKFDFSNMARTNYFVYPTDAFTPDLTSDFARGSFSIANENITETRTIYNSVFSMSDMSLIFNSYLVNLDMDDNGGIYSREIGKKLFYVRSRYAAERSVLYTPGTPRTDYIVGYFTDSAQSLSLDWQFSIDRYYTTFIQTLQKAKRVRRYYDLSVIDIVSFDQTQLIFDEGDIFIVTKINNFIDGKEGQEVELFKVN
jgi:hypothetical protein